MKYEIPKEMADFIVRHFKKRIAYRKLTMPNPEIVDPFLTLDWKDEREAKQRAVEQKKKTLDFIHNATLVIELMEVKE